MGGPGLGPTGRRGAGGAGTRTHREEGGRGWGAGAQTHREGGVTWETHMGFSVSPAPQQESIFFFPQLKTAQKTRRLSGKKRVSEKGPSIYMYNTTVKKEQVFTGELFLHWLVLYEKQTLRVRVSCSRDMNVIAVVFPFVKNLLSV